jgi:transcriptional regulator with XRE-family HTH domain
MENMIKEIRAKRGISQIDLALKAGVHAGNICQYERGLKPNRKTADKIADALGEKPSEVFPNYDSLRGY